MAPELFTSEGVYSFASDLWSLGCILFEFLVGKPPFHSKSLKSLMRMISEDPVPLQLLSGCGSMAKDLIKRLLAKDPAKRANYSTVIQHPFWNDPFFKNEIEEMNSHVIPEEPSFMEYLKGRGIDPKKMRQYQEREVEQAAPPRSRTDYVQLSINAIRNKEGDEYSKQEGEPNDIEIEEDQELDFNDSKVIEPEEKKTPTHGRAYGEEPTKSSTRREEKKVLPMTPQESKKEKNMTSKFYHPEENTEEKLSTKEKIPNFKKFQQNSGMGRKLQKDPSTTDDSQNTPTHKIDSFSIGEATP